MWLAFVSGVMRERSHVSLELPNSIVLLFMSPSDHTWVFAERWLRMEACHQKDQPRDWSVGALKQADLQGRGAGGRGSWRLSSISTSDSINHAYGKEPPKKNFWISKLRAVFCLINTSVCWEGVAHWFHGKRAELCIWNPSRPLSLHLAGPNL